MEDAVEIRAGPVHLVDEHDPRNVVFRSLPPDGFGLRLNTGDTAENNDATIQHAEGPLDFSSEVNVSRRIDDVDAVLLSREKLGHPGLLMLPPLSGDGGGGNRDSTLALLLHPVGRRATIVDFADFVNHPCIEQDPLGERRLARVNVRGDPDISGALEHVLAVWTIRIHGRNLLERVSGIRNGSERRRGWLAPSCARRRVCGRHCLGCWRRP